MIRGSWRSFRGTVAAKRLFARANFPPLISLHLMLILFVCGCHTVKEDQELRLGSKVRSKSSEIRADYLKENQTEVGLFTYRYGGRSVSLEELHSHYAEFGFNGAAAQNKTVDRAFSIAIVAASVLGAQQITAFTQDAIQGGGANPYRGLVIPLAVVGYGLDAIVGYFGFSFWNGTEREDSGAFNRTLQRQLGLSIEKEPE